VCDVLRNTVLNLLGLGLPLVVAIVTIPLLVASLGVERFGILTLIWALVSYFGLFDLGLGRALTRELAEIRGRGEEAAARRLVSTALMAMGCLGVAAGVLLALGAEWSVRQFGGVPDSREAVRAVYAMALAMPFIIMTSGLRGVLEADHLFGVVNAIRLPMGIYTFLAPVAVVKYWGNDLGLVAASLTAGRVLAFFAYAWFCRYAISDKASWFPIDRAQLKGLLRSGGWMTVSNVISPLMGYLDRYVIGLTISVAAVTYYSTPYELITKLWIIPGALTPVLFPRFAQASARDPGHGGELFRRATLFLFVAIYPIALGIALFSRELLDLWLNAEFAAQSYWLLQVFTAGILVNCLAHVPFTFLQATGRVYTTARIHMLEFPSYVLLLWVAAQSFGLIGAVLAWLVRMLADTVLLFYVAVRDMENGFNRGLDGKRLVILLVTTVSFGGVYIARPATRLALWMVSIGLIYGLCWQLLLNPADRAALLKRLPHVSA